MAADVSMGNSHLNIWKYQVVISHFFKKMWDGKLILSVHHLALNFPEDVHPQPLDARGEALSLMLSIIRCFNLIGT
jgi:hypothetical protein